MIRSIVLALLLLLIPARPVEANAFHYSIDSYRGWNTEYRVGFVLGALEMAYVMTREYYPDGHEWSKACFQKKSPRSWAVDIDQMMMNYNPSDKYDVENMSLPEYVQWALEYLCRQ